MIVHPSEPGEIQDRDSATLALFQWGEFMGIKLNSKIVYPVKFSPGYIGVQTSDTIYPGETILSAPNSAMFSTKYINHQQLEKVYDANPSVYSLPDRSHEDNRMLTFFLWELSKGNCSIWQPYFQFLTKDVETIVDWNTDELKQLQDSDLEYMANWKKKKDFLNYKNIQKILGNYSDLFCEEDIEIHKIHWVWKLICTRSYTGHIPYSTLIPIADLFNHSNVSTNYFYGLETDNSPDFYDEKPLDDWNDEDEAMIEEEKSLQLSSSKLYRLSLKPVSLMSSEEQEINDEILKEAKKQDQIVFLQSIF